MTPVVALDVLPADLPAEYAPAMVDACSGALVAGACILAAKLPESTAPEAVALVLWQGAELLQVTVRVGRGGGQWVARSLSFSEHDSISDRWTAVGLTVATLVGETQGLGAPSAPAPELPARTPGGPEPKPDASDKPAHSLVASEHRHRWRMALGALIEPGWVDGGWQRGGWLSGAFLMPGWPVLVHARGSFALSGGPNVQQQKLATQWQGLALGVGLHGTWPRSSISGSAALEIGYRRIDVDLDGRAASTYDIPLRLRTGASLPLAGPFGATFGLSVRLPPQDSRGSEGPALRAALFAVEGFVGVEVRL